MSFELCDKCHWKYPATYLNRMFIKGGYTLPICGVCALEISNNIHGVYRTQFLGEMAEQTRLDAIEWRKNHKECRP